MKAKRPVCGIFLGGTVFHTPWLISRIEKLDYLIAADSGCDMLLQLGFLPHLLLGDMDSIGAATLDACREKQVEILDFPTHKDFTDGEMALEEAVRRGYERLEIYASYGNRFDHTLANVFTAVPYAVQGIGITFINAEFSAHLTIDSLQIEGKAGDIVSLLPLTKTVSGITLQGFAYPLREENLVFASARGISNVLLVIHYPQKNLQKKENICSI